jgi:uracil-DNA glycosylase
MSSVWECPEGWEGLWQESEGIFMNVWETSLQSINEVCPPAEKIFSAYRGLRPECVKVIILGQDPYPSRGVADGRAFSTARGHPVPASLSNIYVELLNSVPGWVRPTHGCLDEWEREGVFLLNSSLTCEVGKSASHQNAWLPFVEKTLRFIYSINPGVVTVLWGNEARKWKRVLPSEARVLEGVHPSPLSVRRGFFGCGHFRLINTLLGEGNEIDWTIKNDPS